MKKIRAKKTKFAKNVAESAIFVALIVVLQLATRPFKNIIVTGIIINFLLVAITISRGLKTSSIVAVLSPISAKILGIGPFWGAIPVILCANFAFVSVWAFFTKNFKNTKLLKILVAIIAAFAKYFVFYVGLFKIIFCVINIKQPQKNMLNAIFGWKQFVTALIGGLIKL
jgi:hypothetical protein